MDKNIKQVLDELYDCVSQQLMLINDLRRQVCGTETITIKSEQDSTLHKNSSPATTTPDCSPDDNNKAASHEHIATRYATRSYPMTTRSCPTIKMPAFKNPSEDSTDKYFKLDIYSDNTFSFELCNINASALQTIKDNKLLPSEVATINGDITKGSTLKVNTPGTGRVEGRIYFIEQPMNVSVINIAE